MCAAMFGGARASAATSEGGRAPIPEPILTETVTDIDGREDKELEVELNASAWRARREGARRLHTSVEVEYRATRWLGLLLEPGWGTEQRALASGQFDLAAGLALSVLRDYERDLFAQMELTSRLPFTADRTTPGDQALPLSLVLRGATRAGFLTLRPGIGFGAGDPVTPIALRAAFALLAPLAPDPRYGFFGVELDADWGRTSPYSVAANLVADCTSVGLPLRLGMAVPWTPGAAAAAPSVGVFFRVFYVSEAEQAFGRASN